MKRMIGMFGVLWVLGLAAGCGQAGKLTTDTGSNQLNFSDFQKVYVVYWRNGTWFATTATTNGSGPNSGLNDSLNNPPGQSMAQQSLLTGDLSGSAGSVLLEARSAIPCNTGFCIDDTRVPLASVNTTGPGYFSLIVPNHGEQIILKGTLGGNTQQVYLGALSGRKDSINLTF